MKSYFALDIETGGIPTNCALVEIGLVYDQGEDRVLDMSSFRAVILPEKKGDKVRWNGDWQEGALRMHKENGLYEELLSAEVDGKTYFSSRKEAFLAAEHWMSKVSGKSVKHPHRLAGKNLAIFDLPFLRVHGWCLNHTTRILDVGSLFLPLDEDGWVPNLSKCLKIAGVENETVTHYAVDDCRATIEAIRWAMKNLGNLSQGDE
jgi:oligoribonuclease (3'-5' exoribonuclease)